jgi:hypothetical protein
MPKINPPAAIRLPQQYASDPALREYHSQINKVIYQLWLQHTKGFDYIDFITELDPDVEMQTGRMAWSEDQGTVQIGMGYESITQYIGYDLFARVENQTGSTLPKGTVLGFSGVGPNNTLSVSRFNANGSVPSLYILGIAPADIPNSGDIGLCSVWGHVGNFDASGSSVGESWAIGDVLYANPATPGALTKVKPTAANVVIPVAAVLNNSATVGEIFVRPTIEQQKYYGEFIKTANQTADNINTAYPITFTSAQISNGVSIGSPASRIVVSTSGLYQVMASIQVTSGSGSKKDARFWWRKNGVDVASSAVLATSDINGGYLHIAMDEFFSLNANNYVELVWAVSNTDLTITSVASTSYAPASPAASLRVTQVQQ